MIEQSHQNKMFCSWGRLIPVNTLQFVDLSIFRDTRKGKIFTETAIKEASHSTKTLHKLCEYRRIRPCYTHVAGGIPPRMSLSQNCSQLEFRMSRTSLLTAPTIPLQDHASWPVGISSRAQALLGYASLGLFRGRGCCTYRNSMHRTKLH